MSARNSLYWLNIVPFFPEYCSEICADIKKLHTQQIATHTAFCCTLVPEGCPTIDKAGDMAELLIPFFSELGRHRNRVGILLQATIGHGWIPDSPATFTRYITPEGSSPYMFCPLDTDFQNYIATAVKKLAQLRPAFFMVDDDFRMYTGRSGCFCERHIACFNQLTGNHYTRESLVSAIRSDKETATAYDTLLRDSLVELATVIRNSIDSVDSTIPCAFCTCSGDLHHTPAIVKALASSKQSHIVRINNGLYMSESPRIFPQWLYRTAAQLAALPKEVTVIAEPDTYPQNRYSTSAAFMHAHNTFSLLEGCQGGKIWISRLGTYEPTSGLAYREKLRDNNSFYRVLSENPIRWQGVAVPLPQQPPLELVDYPSAMPNWTGKVLGRMGVPFYFSKEYSPDTVLALSGSEVSAFTNDELKKILSCKLLMDGEAAIELSKRGFSELIGVAAAPWQGISVSGEETGHGARIKTHDKSCCALLLPQSDQVRILSHLYHVPYALCTKINQLSPGVTLFRNHLGGTVITMAAIVNRLSFASFFLLNESRKRQIIELLNILQPLPAFYADDAEIMLRVGCIKDYTLLVAMNLGLDRLGGLPVVLHGTKLFSVERLQSDGCWMPVSFADRAGNIVLQVLVEPVEPLVFRLASRI